MSLLYRVIYATHANGTHHKLALDSLNKLQVARSEAWRRLFLKHAELYLTGSKAPDKEFKDFRNHVLHPGDTYWGGAPEKARSWYTHLVNALRDENWSEAVWCAGVLSHYYTDPIQPFHTAQSDAESAIHRACEWSISKSYNALYAEGSARATSPEIALPKGETWIEDFVCQGADTSHEHYERLIAHYDINAGASDPPAGLDRVAQNLIADLLLYASSGFALILDRALDEAGVEPPSVDLSVDTVLATLKIPLKWVLNKIDDVQERAAVRAAYDELMATGQVDDNLSDDDRTIRDLHAKEVLGPRRAKRKTERRKRVAKSKTKARKAAKRVKKPKTPKNVKTDVPPAPPVLSTLVTRDVETPQAPRLAPTELRETTSTARVYLAGSDALEAAPAIGAKTAERLSVAGLVTVDDLLGTDPESVAAQMEHSYINAAAITDWQDCARLVMSVPGLRGTHAQLLVGAGFRTADLIAEADPGEFSASVLRFATGKDGSRILRDGTPPDVEKIKSWIESAALARAA